MNDNLVSKSFKVSPKWFYLLPCLILGGAVFTFNSSLELNYLLRGYLVLMEAQIGIIVLYWLGTKWGKKNRKTLNLKSRGNHEK